MIASSGVPITFSGPDPIPIFHAHTRACSHTCSHTHTHAHTRASRLSRFHKDQARTSGNGPIRPGWNLSLQLRSTDPCYRAQIHRVTLPTRAAPCSQSAAEILMEANRNWQSSTATVRTSRAERLDRSIAQHTNLSLVQKYTVAAPLGPSQLQSK